MKKSEKMLQKVKKNGFFDGFKKNAAKIQKIVFERKFLNHKNPNNAIEKPKVV